MTVLTGERKRRGYEAVSVMEGHEIGRQVYLKCVAIILLSKLRSTSQVLSEIREISPYLLKVYQMPASPLLHLTLSLDLVAVTLMLWLELEILMRRSQEHLGDLDPVLIVI